MTQAKGQDLFDPSTGEVEPTEPEIEDQTGEDVIDVEPEAAKENAPATQTALAIHDRKMYDLAVNMQQTLERAQKLIEFNGGLRKLIVANMRKGHWVRFGNRIRPDVSECIRLRTLLGINLEISEPVRREYTDAAGTYYEYTCTGKATLGPMEVPGFGASDSRTKFFARKDGKLRPVDEVNSSFIAKMCWTDCIKKLVGGLLALDLDPGELVGITGENVADAAAGFKGGKTPPPAQAGSAPNATGTPTMPQNQQRTPDSAETGGKRQEVRNAILTLTGNNPALAGDFLDYLTSFVTKDGKAVKGKKKIDWLTEKQVHLLYDRRAEKLSAANYQQFLAQRAAVS